MTVEDQAPQQLISYAQNGEDIVLWRALGQIQGGNYIDVGAAHPILDSVTKVFYDHGWSGINVEPLPQLADELRTLRPRDLVVEAGVGETEGKVTFYGVPETGLSSLSSSVVAAADARGFGVTELEINLIPLDKIAEQRFQAGDDIHFLKVDVEGAEESVLRGFDLNRWRPWVVVVEATEPNGTKSTRDSFEYLLTDSGYTPALFDGLNVFYVAPDHPELLEALSFPANPIDGFVRVSDVRGNEALQWKSRWAGAQAQLVDLERMVAEQKRLAEQARRRAVKQRKRVERLQNSPWWRVTAPGRRSVGKLKARQRGNAGSAKAVTGRKPGVLTSTDPMDVGKTVAERLAYICHEHGIATADDTSLADSVEAITDLLSSTKEPHPLLWLLFITFTSSFPTQDDMRELAIQFDLGGAAGTISWLAQNVDTRRKDWAVTAPIRLVTTPLIDVSHTARYDLHTGIQRVVRETVRRWAENHELDLMVLDRTAKVWRPVSELEEGRVIRWGFDPNEEQTNEFAREICVPWNTVVVLPELAGAPNQPEVLTALKNWSNSEFCALFYDMIPFSMSEACADGMHGAFAHYLTTIRNSDRVSTISASVGEDLVGFLTAVKNQGLEPPSVRSHMLPIEAEPISTEAVELHRGSIAAVPGVPVVLSVSSIEPRKNQTMTLVAAERLWREGHSFQLVFIAGSGWNRDLFDKQLAVAQQNGRPVRVISQASEGLLWAAYRVARFSVFISLTEGFGLPAAESISSGTPVVLSNFGSMLEIGEGGGAQFVDPRSLDEVTDAMRLLLTDDDRLNQLKREGQQRHEKTWDEYSKETWSWLVDGE